MLIFGCPVGVRIHQKTFRNHVPINYDIHTTKNHQNISKNLPKTAPKITQKSNSPFLSMSAAGLLGPKLVPLLADTDNCGLTVSAQIIGKNQ